MTEPIENIARKIIDGQAFTDDDAILVARAYIASGTYIEELVAEFEEALNDR